MQESKTKEIKTNTIEYKESNAKLLSEDEIASLNEDEIPWGEMPSKRSTVSYAKEYEKNNAKKLKKGENNE